MYEFPGLHGGNRLAGGSLRTVATIFVRIQAERKDGDLVLVCVNIFIPCTCLSGCAGRTVFPPALYLRSWRFWFAYKWNGRGGFGCGVFFVFFTMNISPGLRGGHPLADESLLTLTAIFTAILVRIRQAERESRYFILLCFNFFIP